MCCMYSVCGDMRHGGRWSSCMEVCFSVWVLLGEGREGMS